MSVGDFAPNVSFLPSSYVTLLLTLAILYVETLLIYRLYYAPVAKFPGPRLAAITFFYEFYYDVWLEGQYTWKIQDLHKQYGMYLLILAPPFSHRSCSSRPVRPHQSVRSSLQ